MSAKIITAAQLAVKAKEVAQSYKTLYVKGCIGAPLRPEYKMRYCTGVSEARKRKILNASADTFGFDCVCFIKSLLWGWCGNTNHCYGGAKYASNGVPDIGTEEMIRVCSGVSTDFSKIEVGELVWGPGHVGLYIGDGLAVECTSAWNDNVQITACNCTKSGYNRRDWAKHGKLPYVDYDTGTQTNQTVTKTEEKKMNVQLQLPVLKKGAVGEAVKALQALLNLRVGAGMYIDGSFGEKTDAALREYQRVSRLAVDGSCGAASWAALLTR